MSPRTLADKLWDAHVVRSGPDGSPDLLYIDLHLVHEVTSPQAFDGLRLASRWVRRPELTLAIEDHNVPTDSLTLQDPMGRQQIEALRANCAVHGVELFRLGEDDQGIVHVVAPQLGYVLPGMSVVCGDSHTSTHGAFGALAFGIGTSDIEHVLATQTLSLTRPRTMAVDFDGDLPDGVEPKDVALGLIAEIGTDGGQGHTIEYRGEVIRRMSMTGRQTLCNMSIEAGARAGMVAPDERTFTYLLGRPHAPVGDAWDEALAYWRSLPTDPGATFDRQVRFDVATLAPYVTWGTNPAQAVRIDAAVPAPDSFQDEQQREAARRALTYMDLAPGTPIRDVPIDVVFLGSCTNARLDDLRSAAAVLAGRRIAPGVRMLVVPGSMRVRRQAEEEGLHEVFLRAGASWRLPGCSMCPGLNGDRLTGRARVASTSNRNYEGRLGGRSRAHLVSPSVAAATAVAGRLVSPADLN